MTIIELLKEKTIWVIEDFGYCYVEPLKLFYTKEEAIKEWEKISYKSYNNYQEIINKHYSQDGHWYYQITEINLLNIFEKYEKSIIYNNIEQIRQEQNKLKNSLIEYNAKEKEKQRIKDILSGMIYYLMKNNLIDEYFDICKEKEKYLKFK